MPTTPGVMSDTEAGPLRTHITRHSGAMASEGLAPRSSRSEASRRAEQHSMAAQDEELRERGAETGVQSDVINVCGEQVANANVRESVASEHVERGSEQGEAQSGQESESDSDTNVRMRGNRARQLRVHDDEGETTDGSRSATSSRASRRGSKHGLARLEAAMERMASAQAAQTSACASQLERLAEAQATQAANAALMMGDMSIAASKQYTLNALDIKTAYLNANLEDNVDNIYT